MPVPPVAPNVCEYGAPTVPFDKEPVVIESGAGLTVMLRPFVAVAPELSRTCTVTGFVPAAVGVPLTVAPFNERPAGSDPAVIDQVYPPVPPVAASDCEYGEPTLPLASDAVVTESGAGFTRIVNAFVAVVFELSRTWAVKLEVPAAVGVPEITPAALNVNPAGSDPALTVHEFPPLPPVADSVCEYAAPTVPFARLPGETVSGGGFTLMLNAWVSVAAELSFTCAVKLEVPAVVGVPVIAPAVLIPRPAGSDPALIEYV